MDNYINANGDTLTQTNEAYYHTYVPKSHVFMSADS